MQNRKTTAWKKNRKFGDIYGGRERVKHSDKIFRRYHSLQRPSGTDVTPILMEDNPSRDYFFPISVEEAHEALKALPEWDQEGLTHIWLRRHDPADYRQRSHNWAEFICGSGVRVVTPYPWRRDMIYEWTHHQPSRRTIGDLQDIGFKFRKRRSVVSAMLRSKCCGGSTSKICSITRSRTISIGIFDIGARQIESRSKNLPSNMRWKNLLRRPPC